MAVRLHPARCTLHIYAWRYKIMLRIWVTPWCPPSSYDGCPGGNSSAFINYDSILGISHTTYNSFTAGLSFTV
jgi:hypothetical protein